MSKTLPEIAQSVTSPEGFGVETLADLRYPVVVRMITETGILKNCLQDGFLVFNGGYKIKGHKALQHGEELVDEGEVEEALSLLLKVQAVILERAVLRDIKFNSIENTAAVLGAMYKMDKRAVLNLAPALAHATEGLSVPLVEILLANGAIAALQDKDGDTALHYNSALSRFPGNKRIEQLRGTEDEGGSSVVRKFKDDGSVPKIIFPKAATSSRLHESRPVVVNSPSPKALLNLRVEAIARIEKYLGNREESALELSYFSKITTNEGEILEINDSNFIIKNNDLYQVNDGVEAKIDEEGQEYEKVLQDLFVYQKQLFFDEFNDDIRKKDEGRFESEKILGSIFNSEDVVEIVNTIPPNNSKGVRQLSPLSKAVLFGHIRCVELLLNSGANPTAVSGPKGRTPFHYAALSQGSIEPVTIKLTGAERLAGKFLSTATIPDYQPEDAGVALYKILMRFNKGDCEEQDNDGETPRELLEERGESDIFEAKKIPNTSPEQAGVVMVDRKPSSLSRSNSQTHL